MSPPPSPARRSGRPAVLNHADIVAAALVIVDEGGPDALTMRGLGARLGVTAMSLYRHLPNRDAVLTAVVDHLAAGAATDPDGTWQEAVRDFAGAYRSVLLDHPRAVPLLATHPVTIETGLEMIAGTLARFAAVGIDRDRALTVVQSAIVFTLGHALAQVGTGGLPPPEDAGYYEDWFADGLGAMIDGFARRMSP